MHACQVSTDAAKMICRRKWAGRPSVNICCNGSDGQDSLLSVRHQNRLM